MTTKNTQLEWLEADGLGGYAMGTTRWLPFRRYHSLYTVASGAMSRRFVLLPFVEVALYREGNRVEVISLGQLPAVENCKRRCPITSFNSLPYPHWTFEVDENCSLLLEVCMPRGSSATILRGRLLGTSVAPYTIQIRPYLAGRDHHALHFKNDAISPSPDRKDSLYTWELYQGVPNLIIASDSTFEEDHTWAQSIYYAEEDARGFDAREDWFSPGYFLFESSGDAVIGFTTSENGLKLESKNVTTQLLKTLSKERTRRASLPTLDEKLSEKYLVKKGTRQSIIAGYPWFSDWGRDTFISMRGLLLAQGKLDEAEAILSSWATTRAQGLLPNQFLDTGGLAEFNTVDASLWYCICVFELLTAANKNRRSVASKKVILEAVDDIIDHYKKGTKYHIQVDTDGLIAAGFPGMQLTWMDAKVENSPVTQRSGKPVEIQALWINVLLLYASHLGRYREEANTALSAFESKFWNEKEKCLYDVIDVQHQAGVIDAKVRPNQIFAVGGLPRMVISKEKAKLIVEKVERELFTVNGLRSLSPFDPDYRSHYRGSPKERDSAYHQGTAWAWLLGPFVEAWLRVNLRSTSNERRAIEEFLIPFKRQLGNAGVNHFSELADADSPEILCGAPFQAWSLGEYIRIKHLLHTI